MKKVLLKYDRTRPVTAAVNFHFEGGLRDVVDIEGINYNIDQYEKFRKNHPSTPMFGSENGQYPFHPRCLRDGRRRRVTSAPMT